MCFSIRHTLSIKQSHTHRARSQGPTQRSIKSARNAISLSYKNSVIQPEHFMLNVRPVYHSSILPCLLSALWPMGHPRSRGCLRSCASLLFVPTRRCLHLSFAYPGCAGLGMGGDQLTCPREPVFVSFVSGSERKNLPMSPKHHWSCPPDHHRTS